MEYALSSSIKKLSVVDKPLIGLIQGHGEPSRAALQQAMTSLGILYTIEEVDLNNQETDLAKYSTLALIAPRDTIPPHHFHLLDQYMAAGGDLCIALNRVEGDFSTAQGKPVVTGTENWLNSKGLIVEDNFVIDANCGTVGVQQQMGGMNFTTQIQFPYLPRIRNFADHPITKGLEEVILQFASSINYAGDTNMVFTPFAFSSERSGTLTTPLYFDINKKWNNNDFPMSDIVVGGVLTGNTSGGGESSIVLFSDGDFAINGEGQRPQQLPADNVSLMVNAIDWLSDETGLIELRTKAVTSRPLDQVEDARKNLIKWLNFLIPLLIVVLYGIFRSQRTRRIRNKRMEEGYV